MQIQSPIVYICSCRQKLNTARLQHFCLSCQSLRYALHEISLNEALTSTAEHARTYVPLS